MYDVFLHLEMLCSQDDRLHTREMLILAMFKMAIKQGEDAIALHMSIIFQSVLLRSTEIVVPIIISNMQKDMNTINEFNMSLLQRLQSKFHFRDADALVTLLEKAKSE